MTNYSGEIHWILKIVSQGTSCFEATYHNTGIGIGYVMTYRVCDVGVSLCSSYRVYYDLPCMGCRRVAVQQLYIHLAGNTSVYQYVPTTRMDGSEVFCESFKPIPYQEVPDMVQ